MQVRFTTGAIRDLRKIGPMRDTILSKIEQYAVDPSSLANNVKALRGTSQYRLRVGDYRALFTVEEDGSVTIMLVEAIRHRREAYD